eukprot:SM000075S22004  [mRNA]  locus=s75:575009:575702:+ [translate_table: standard]
MPPRGPPPTPMSFPPPPPTPPVQLPLPPPPPAGCFIGQAGQRANGGLHGIGMGRQDSIDGHHPFGTGHRPACVGHHPEGDGHHPPGNGHHPPGNGHHPLLELATTRLALATTSSDAAHHSFCCSWTTSHAASLTPAMGSHCPLNISSANTCQWADAGVQQIRHQC